MIFCPRDAEGLAGFLASCPADLLLPVGAGSNLLVRDGGVAGVVIRMNQFMTAIHYDGNEITAGPGPWMTMWRAMPRVPALPGWNS